MLLCFIRCLLVDKCLNSDISDASDPVPAISFLWLCIHRNVIYVYIQIHGDWRHFHQNQKTSNENLK